MKWNEFGPLYYRHFYYRELIAKRFLISASAFIFVFQIRQKEILSEFDLPAGCLSNLFLFSACSVYYCIMYSTYVICIYFFLYLKIKAKSNHEITKSWRGKGSCEIRNRWDFFSSPFWATIFCRKSFILFIGVKIRKKPTNFN